MSSDLKETQSLEFHKDLVAHLETFAIRRNIKAIFIIILIYEFIVLVVVAVFSYVEIQVYRFNEPLLFAVLYSVTLAIFLILYLGFHVFVYLVQKDNYPYIYDRILVRNIQAQLSMCFGLPTVSLFIILVRWLYYAKVGTTVDFHTLDGFLYGNMSFISFIIAVCGIMLIVTNAGSYYNVFVIPASNQVFEKEKYKPNEYFEFHELVDDDTGREFYAFNMK